MKVKIKTIKKNEKSVWMLVLFEDKVLLRVKEHLPKSMVNKEIDGELSGNDLRVVLPSGFTMVLENAKIRHLEQSEYDKFLVEHPKYKFQIDNYVRWFKSK